MNWQTDFLAAHPCLTHLTLCKVNFCWLQILLNNHTANRLPPVSLVCCTNSWRLQACLSCLWPHTSNRSLRKSQENTVKENTVTVASWRTVENRGGLWRQATVLKCFPQSSAAFASPRHSKHLQCLTAIMSNRIIKGGKRWQKHNLWKVIALGNPLEIFKNKGDLIIPKWNVYDMFILVPGLHKFTKAPPEVQR